MSKMNPELFKDVFGRMLQGIASLAGKEALLVVGRTGAGKSTTINYLLNLLIQETADSTAFQRKYTAVGGATIGNQMESQTLLPSAYDFQIDESSGASLSVVDTAGLGDTRGPEISLTVSLAIKLISEMARVKGVVMVLPQQHFFSDRGIHLVETFELISQMTTEFNPETFMFCVTGLPNIPEADVEKTKTLLCQKLQEAAAIVDERIRAAGSDVTEKRRLENIALALRRCMTQDNLFLMTDLANRAQQQKVRSEFYERTKVMKGFTKPLELAMPRELSLELQTWSLPVAQQANTLLTDRAETYIKANETAQRQRELTHLHRSLLEAVTKNREMLSLLERAAETKREINARLTALQERANETVKERVEHAFRVPNPGSGFSGGQLSKRIVKASGDRFDHLELPLGAKIVSDNRVTGSFKVLLEHKLNGTETNPFKLGFDVVYRRCDLPAYQEELARVKEELLAFEHEVAQARREQAAVANQVERLQLEMNRSAKVLGLPLESDETTDSLLRASRIRLEALNSELLEIHKRRAAIDATFAEHREAFQFLDDVAGLAGLDRMQPPVAEFRKLYGEAKKVVLMDAERMMECSAERLRSPTHSQAAMFSSVARLPVVDPLLRQQQALTATAVDPLSFR